MHLYACMYVCMSMYMSLYVRRCLWGQVRPEALSQLTARPLTPPPPLYHMCCLLLDFTRLYLSACRITSDSPHQENGSFCLGTWKASSPKRIIP